MNKLFKTRQEAWISSTGLVILLALFAYWWATDSAVNIAGHLAAVFSVFLFAIVCLRFVPNWIEFWSAGSEFTEISNQPKPNVLIRLFVEFLAIDFLTVYIIHAIRVFAFGDTTSFREGLDLFLHIDAGAYLGIAENGYFFDRNLVFYPGYPLLVRLAGFAIGDWMISGLSVSALFYALSACMLYKLLLLDYSHDEALRAVKYLAILPGAFFFICPMTESLFLFLCLASLFLARTGKWLPACILGAYAAFTRSLGVLVFAPLFFEAVHGLKRNRDEKPLWLRRIICCFIVLLGTLAYLFINYRITGDWFAFSKLEEEHWSQSMGFFFDTTAFQIDNALADIQQPWFRNALGLWFPNVAWCFAVLLLMAFAAKKLRASYSVWFICYYVFAIGATYLISAPRYLVACAPVYPALVCVTGNKKTDRVLTVFCLVFAVYYLFAFAARWEVF